MSNSPRPAPDELTIVLTYVLERVPAGVSIDAAALVPPARPGFTYDVGPHCPRDELYYRLQASRALQRLDPPELRPILRWTL